MPEDLYTNSIVEQIIYTDGPPVGPHTPTNDKRRSRFSSPLQSPMIKIKEEVGVYDNEKTLADLQPPPQSKRLSGHFGGSPIHANFYSLDLNSASSLYLPGGNVPGNRSSMSSLKYVPAPSLPSRNRSPTRHRSPSRKASPTRSRSQSPNKIQPFNFKSTRYDATPVAASKASYRKGHRYKHSSVSMNFFQEPKQRAPLKIPASFPIPTYKEIFASCSFDQKVKMSWSIFHLFFALITFLVGFKYSLHSFSTLSHLMFYDSLACIIVVFVNIMGNFDVWSKSSIKYPFGLGRLEVLCGFALSISLIFVGCDLVSHFIEEFMFYLFENGDSHVHSGGHNHHEQSEGSPTIGFYLYESVMLMTVIITFISSNLTTKDKLKPALTSSFSTLKESILTNPTHIITLIFAICLALDPIVKTVTFDIGIDRVATLIVSLSICYMGWKVVKFLGYIVLLSFPESSSSKEVVNKITQSIEESDYFKSSYRISNLIISKVHMNLTVVLLNIKMAGGSDDDESNLRSQINELIEKTVKGSVETTVDIDRF